MKLTLSIFIIIITALSCMAQDSVIDETNEKIIQKQLIVADIENRVKEIPYAAVRVSVRYRTAAWLSKDGPDDSGRAVDIITAALEDHYQNRSLIPYVYHADVGLFRLLELNDKETAKQLREKYNRSAAEDPRAINSELNKENGDKLAVDMALRILNTPNQNPPDIVYLVMQLHRKNSPELDRLVSGIIAAEYNGTTVYPVSSITIFSQYFLTPAVSPQVESNFLRLIVGRAFNIMQSTPMDQQTFQAMLRRLMPRIQNDPELFAQAGPILGVLATSVPRTTREAQERFERIQNSADKLAATIAEAEQAEEELDKYTLYFSAARLALQAKRFNFSIELMDKARERDLSKMMIPTENLSRTHDSFYGNIVESSLNEKQPDPAHLASQKIISNTEKIENLGRILKYFVESSNYDRARDIHNEVYKLASRTELDRRVLAVLLRMIPESNKIDPMYGYELNRLISNTLNKLPELKVEDIPGTENFREYVTDTMFFNMQLLNVMNTLILDNRSIAEDLANRITRSESKVVAEMVLKTNPLVIEHEKAR